MKKYFIFLFLIAFLVEANGNVTPPCARISEFSFDSTGNWTLEFGLPDYSVWEIDSLVITTSLGTSRILFFSLLPGGGSPYFDSLAVVTNSNMSVPIYVNPTGDYIKLTTYAYWQGCSDSVAFGNWYWSQFSCIKPGESISYLSYGGEEGFTIDKTPSFGVPNDYTDVFSIFSGTIFDLSGNVFTGGWFIDHSSSHDQYSIHVDGSFSGSVFSKLKAFDTIEVHKPGSPPINGDYTVVPVSICLRPDTTYNVNIYTTSIINDVNNRSSEFQEVTVSPNPFTTSVIFYFHLDQTYTDVDLDLVIINLSGKMIQKTNIQAHQKSYEWIPDHSLGSSIFTYILRYREKEITSGKLVKL